MDFYVASVIAQFVEDDKDLCSMGLASRWMHAIALDEMARTRKKRSGPLCERN